MSESEKEIRDALKRTYGEQPICYMKISDNLDWIKDVENGKLYLNTVQYFRDLEKKQLEEKRKTRQSDGKEVKLAIKAENLCCLDEKTGAIVFAGKEADCTFAINGDNEIRIFCLMGFCVDDFDIENYSENEVILKFPYNHEELEKLKSDFGIYAILIEGIHLHNRLQKVLNSTDRYFLVDKIDYSVANRLDRFQAFSEQSAKRFFYKDTDFQYQRESRIVVLDKIVGNYLEIGDIKGFSGKISVDDVPNHRLRITFTTKKK